MPNNVVKTKKQEKLWKKAEKIAEKQGQKENYAYIMGIYKKMGGLKKEDFSDRVKRHMLFEKTGKKKKKKCKKKNKKKVNEAFEDDYKNILISPSFQEISKHIIKNTRNSKDPKKERLFRFVIDKGENLYAGPASYYTHVSLENKSGKPGILGGFISYSPKNNKLIINCPELDDEDNKHLLKSRGLRILLKNKNVKIDNSKDLNEAMSLEDAMNEPAALWVQGLKPKEYNKFISIIAGNYNDSATERKLKKVFPDLTDNLYNEMKRFARKAIVKAVPKDEIYVKGFKGNFLGIGLEAGKYEKSEIFKKAFDEVRN